MFERCVGLNMVFGNGARGVVGNSQLCGFGAEGEMTGVVSEGFHRLDDLLRLKIYGVNGSGSGFLDSVESLDGGVAG